MFVFLKNPKNTKKSDLYEKKSRFLLDSHSIQLINFTTVNTKLNTDSLKRIKTIVLIIVVFTSFSIGYTQNKDPFTFWGYFNGTNLNVQCKSAQNELWLACDCIDSLAVNGKVIPDILYEGYQIDLANKTDLKIQDSVEVVLFAQNSCQIRLLNPNNFFPATILPVKDLRINKSAKIEWMVQENYPQLRLWVQIEQYKWGEWVKIGPNINITKKVSYELDVTPYLNKGENQFRAVVASIDHDRIPSDPILLKHRSKKIKLKLNKKSKVITFSSDTHYEVWDESWLIAARGRGALVDLSHLANGKYHVRYGNRVKVIFVK
jgi:hypothetical protein